MLLPGLVAEEFHTEDVAALAHLLDGHMAVLRAEVVVIRLLGSFLGDGDSGERYGFVVGGVQQLCGNSVLGTQTGRNQQAGNQGEGFSEFDHIGIYDAHTGAKFILPFRDFAK